MKNDNRVKICYGLSLILFIVFIIKTVIEYGKYNSILNSAPFYIWVIVNIIYFIVPAIIALIIGLVLSRKQEKTDQFQLIILRRLM